MRLFITGPSSTGKSTLLNAFKENEELIKCMINEGKDYKYNIEYHEELCRSYFADHDHGFKTYDEMLADYDATMDYWKNLINEYIKLLSRTGASNYLYLFDRGTHDYIVNYALNYVAGTDAQMQEYAEEYGKVSKRLLGWLENVNNNNIIFRVVDSVPLQQDGFRPKSREYMRPLELMLFEITMNRDVIQLSGSTDERLATLINTLRVRLPAYDPNNPHRPVAPWCSSGGWSSYANPFLFNK